VCSLLVRPGPDTREFSITRGILVCLVASERVGFTGERQVRNRIRKVALVWRVGADVAAAEPVTGNVSEHVRVRLLSSGVIDELA
jgi:hypothetical protein